MKRVRILAGLLSLAALAVALNLLILKEDLNAGLFTWSVLAPLGLSVLCGIVWLVLRLVQTAGSFERGKLFHWINTTAASVLFLGICIVVYAMAAHWDRSWDLTREGRRELSEQTIQVLKSLREDVTVLCLFIRSGDKTIDTARDKTQRFLERCRQYTNCLHIEFADPQTEQARLKAMGVSHASPLGTVVLQRGSRNRAISLVGENPRLQERDFTNALINVARTAEPMVYFLTGHGERDPYDKDQAQGAVGLRNLLTAEAYKVDRLALGSASPDVPSDCDVLVILDPQSDLDARELDALTAYLERGGRMLVMLEPKYRAVTPGFLAWMRDGGGILIGEDLIVSKYEKKLGAVTLYPDATALKMLQDLNISDTGFDGCFEQRHPITHKFGQQMYLSTVRTVRSVDKPPAEIVVTQLARTMPYAWSERDLLALQNREAPVQDEDEPAGSLGVAVAAVRKTDVPIGDTAQTRDGRLVVIGDADLALNQSLAVGGHLNFLLNAMAWLTEREELIAIRPTGVESKPVILSEDDEKIIAWVAILGVLQAGVVAGLAAYMLRRKHQ